MLPLSVLDLSVVTTGAPPSAALRNSIDLARHVDGLGYVRYWLAEHHNLASVASPAPDLMIGQIAAATSKIRVGSGGVMLPNHAPLKVAENFRLLEALHPGRIDLGIGRAPGTDGATALALRRSRDALRADDFPEQMDSLLGFFGTGFDETPKPFGYVAAIPTDVPTPEIYLLGSSDFSARLAAHLGLGFAFAHHIQPEPAALALRLYREQFQPSEHNPAPRALVAISAICAETDALADEIARSADLAILRLHQGRLKTLPSVAEATDYPYTPEERESVRHYRATRLFVGSPETLRERLTRFAVECGVDEVVVTTLVHDHTLRRRSYELLAEAFGLTEV